MNEQTSLTRREFLGTGGKAAATQAAAKAFGPTILRAKPAGENIGVGCIGMGTRGGDGLVKHFTKLPECQCVATCDPFKDRRENWAKYIDGVYAVRDGKASSKGCGVGTNGSKPPSPTRVTPSFAPCRPFGLPPPDLSSCHWCRYPDAVRRYEA